MEPTDLIEGFDFSVSALIAGLIFGVVGLYLFRHGRKIADLRFVLLGIAMMLYPYFTKGPWIDWVIGAALCALGYYFKINPAD